jgi:hypothetical protein
MMNDTAYCPAGRSRLKWGRIICLAGAIGLCVSFFMPQFVYYREKITPENAAAEAPVEYVTTRNYVYLLSSGRLPLPFFAAILLTPLLAFRAVPRVDAAKGVGKFLAWAACAICLFVLITGLGWLTYGFVTTISLNPLASIEHRKYAVPAVGFVGLALAVVALVRSPLPRKAAAALFALWAYCLAYFALMVASPYDPVFAGLWLTIAASGTLVIGSAIDWFQCRPIKQTLR